MTLQSYLTKLMVTIFVFSSLWLAWSIRDILIILFVSFILAAAIKPLAQKMNHKLRIPLAISIILILTLLMFVVGFFVYLVIPPLISEIIQLVRVLTNWLGISEINFDWLAPRNSGDFMEQLREYDDIFVRYGQTATTLLLFIQSTITGVILVFTVLVLTYYMITSQKSISKMLANLFPVSVKDREQEAELLLARLDNKLGGWVRGRALVMFIIGISTYIALWMMGIPYALALALIAAVLEIIPHFGPIIAAVPAILVATFLVNPLAGILVLVYYTTLQQIESAVITPQVMKHAVDVEPLVTVFLVLTGLHVMGVVGGILSLPFYICVKIMVKGLTPHYSKWLKSGN